MDKATAIGELSAILKERSDGYYIHLCYGGKNDPGEEKMLNALDFAIKYMQGKVEENAPDSPDSLRPKGRWEKIGYDDVLDRITCSHCKEYWNILDNDTETFNFCPNCGADMRGDDGDGA